MIFVSKTPYFVEDGSDINFIDRKSENILSVFDNVIIVKKPYKFYYN